MRALTPGRGESVNPFRRLNGGGLTAAGSDDDEDDDDAVVLVGEDNNDDRGVDLAGVPSLPVGVDSLPPPSSSALRKLSAPIVTRLWRVEYLRGWANGMVDVGSHDP